MPNRIICLARPPVKGDEFISVPELRLIDPSTSATSHGHVPKPDDDAALLLAWLDTYLPPATLDALKERVGRDWHALQALRNVRGY